MKAAVLALCVCGAANAGHMAPGGTTWYQGDVLDGTVTKYARLSACLDVHAPMGPGQYVDEEGNSLVYLTATNSAPHSVEVVVIYNRNRFEPSVSFGIYDWGTPKDWKWRDYRQFQLGDRLCYQNIAKRVQGNAWRNIVRVKLDGRYRTIFSSEYQQTEYARTWWGPISEEFPPGASADMPSANWSWTLSIDGKEWRK